MAPSLDPSFYPEYAAECGDPSRTKRLGFGTRPAILLVDVCDAYCLPSSPLGLAPTKVEAICAAIASLLKAARGLRAETKEIPVLYAQTLYTHPSLRDAGLTVMKMAHASLFHSHNASNLASIPSGYPAIRPQPHDILLKKKYPSPFFGTNLATQLASFGVDTLIIAGFTTSGSVRAATLDAMQSGFRAMVVAEACGDRGKETHWANLMDMGAKYGDVVSVEEANDNLRQGWGGCMTDDA